jgi:hypothetical protein
MSDEATLQKLLDKRHAWAAGYQSCQLNWLLKLLQIDFELVWRRPIETAAFIRRLTGRDRAVRNAAGTESREYKVTRTTQAAALLTVIPFWTTIVNTRHLANVSLDGEQCRCGMRPCEVHSISVPESWSIFWSRKCRLAYTTPMPPL